MKSTKNALSTVVAAVSLLAGLSACGSSDATTRPADASVPAPAGTQVSANDATEEELVAALEAVGVSPAAKWADEIMEYRPHEAGFDKLREELAKYNPSAETLEKIISVLKP